LGYPTRSDYRDEIHARYAELIDFRLGKTIAIPKGVDERTVAKAVSPKPYSGLDNIETFDDWLMSVVAWMAMSGLGGSKHDESRVLLVGLHLSGEARTWYNDKVEGLYRVRRDWTFKDVIFGLYDRFIFESSTRQAADKYRSILYEEDKGFSSFYNSLTKYAHRMICALDQPLK
jgi:hypothetical protein